jgi:hypothetical protein
MRKRLLFVGVVILSISSVASAGIWSWFFSVPWEQTTPNSQTQAFSGSWVQVGVNVGPGSAADTNPGSYSNTQTTVTPSGGTMTQSTNVTGIQVTSITGGPGSVGVSSQTISVQTYQSQSIQ